MLEQEHDIKLVNSDSEEEHEELEAASDESDGDDMQPFIYEPLDQFECKHCRDKKCNKCRMEKRSRWNRCTNHGRS